MCDEQNGNAVMLAAAPQISCRQAESLVQRLYGLQGRVTPLTGERDMNFCLTLASGKRYMLKAINAGEPQAVSHFQTALLLHIALHAADLPVPRVVLTRYQQAEPMVEVDDAAFRVRLVSFLEGVPQHTVAHSPALMRSLGGTLARLDRTLGTFSHPGAQRRLLWDIGRAEQIRPYLDAVRDEEQRRHIGRVLSRFDDHVAPALPALRHQTIHNDLNPHNVLVDAQQPTRVSGIIDFGDALHAPLVNELATALAYQVDDGDDPFTFIVPFTAAYQRQLPLSEAEIALLPDLIATRMALTLTIAQWRAARYPENSAYLLRNVPRCWRSLHHLARYPHQQFYRRLQQATEEEYHD